MNPANDRGRRRRIARRTFLQAGTAAAAAIAANSPLAVAWEPTAASSVKGKDPRLILHTARPAVLETPPQLLIAERVTPTPLLFVRNNQQPVDAATLEPAKLAGWTIELSGLVDQPQTFDAAATLEALDPVECEMVLQCSGNSRALFTAAAPVKGTLWGRGAMGNVKFAGVPLSKLLEHLAVRPQEGAKFLTAEGRDAPEAGEQDFEHSIPLDDALEKSFLALRLNGQPLPAIHGGPVRLVTPGYYGTMHVKWLSRLRFEPRESDHTSQIPHYRTPREPIKPGQPFEFTYANSDPNWRMKIKSVVLSPPPGARVSPGEIEVKGVAFNDGESRIDSVLISTDAGRTWKAAELAVPESPYAWYGWRTKVKLAFGNRQIWARAFDRQGRSQPLDGALEWNPSGYTYSAVEKIDLIVA